MAIAYPIEPDKWLTSKHQKVRCPNCGFENDFRDIDYGGYERGSTVQCYEEPTKEQPNRQGGCLGYMTIVKVEKTTLISVRRARGPGGIPASIGGR